VPITTKVVSSNPIHGEVYSMQNYTTLCDKVGQWLVTGRWISPVSSTNKTDRHDITEILLKEALNTINQIKKPKLDIDLRFSSYSISKTYYISIIIRRN
jgi:hypothetical protein